MEAVFEEFTPRFVRQELLKRGLTELPDAEETIDGTVCILGNVFSRNFCHWHEEMMKVIVLETIGYECNYVIAELPAFAKELLRLIGIAPERILEVRRPTRFRSALFTTPVSYRNVAIIRGCCYRCGRDYLQSIGGKVGYRPAFMARPRQASPPGP